MQFQPSFPASCKPSPLLVYCTFGWLPADARSLGPFVTAVGATTGANPEIAVSFSAGGFSNYFAQPSYQTEAVTAYIESLNGTYDGLYKCGFHFLKFCGPLLSGVVHRHSTVLQVVGSRMLLLVVIGTG